MIKHLFYLSLMISICFGFHAHAWASSAEPFTFEVDSKTEFPVEVGSSMQYLEDESRQLSIDEVITTQRTWHTIDTASPNFGFTTSRMWFRFIIDHQSEKDRTVYVELPVPFLDEIQLFHRYEQTLIKQYLVGDQLPFEKRPIIHENFVMLIELGPGQNEIFLSVTNNGTVEAPIYVWSPEAFSSANAQKELIQGLWIGIILVMIIYNIFIYTFVRDKSYLYYVLFAGNYMLTEITIRGYGFAYIWPEMTFWNNLAIPVFMSSTSFCLAILVSQYLNLKERSVWSFRTMNVLAALSLVLTILSLFAPYAITIRMAFLLASSVCFASCVIGYLLWSKGYADARFYCIAWTSAFVGIAVLLAVKFGLLPENIWTSQSTQIGIILLIVFLSVAMGNRFNLEKEMRLKAQGAALHAERQARLSEQALLATKQSANEELERKVGERTLKLKRALDELELANNRLEVLSTTDSLTGLFNRGHFENHLDTEFSRAKRHERDLSVILCDIDHFKSINDTYGHKAGDECLKLFARILQDKITRSGDIVARFGGEEFIILLPDTSRDQAFALAQGLCDTLESKPFNYRKKDIRVTASFGVASITQTHTTSADSLVNNADIALYKAKDSGRSRVAV